MILHSLSAVPTSRAFQQCLRFLHTGDALLLLGDGVYAALADTDSCNKLMETGAELYVLEQDALAAGILERVEKRISAVEFDMFVALSERFPRQQAWY